MTTRRVDAPPAIPGFSFLQTLGSGGFADVHLYEQAMPRRRVAVKVLFAGLSGSAERQAFESEANLMASLSTHPSIVTIYQADVAPDGRPYLVMEYCPRPNLGRRIHGERMSVIETTRVAVQVAAAVETAHRAGILHRDIKPANVLFTEYGRPALADFGIAGTIADADAGTTGGLSVPWSPPEAFGDGPTDTRLDVYALGATAFAMLTGRSPFEVPGGRNTAQELMRRIQSGPVPSLGRDDVPASLRRAVETALQKDPQARQASALEFARDLQKVQAELDLPPTPIDLLDTSADAPVEQDDDEGRTRVRGIVRIDPAGETVHRVPGAAAPSDGHETVRRPPAAFSVRSMTVPGVADTIRPQPAAAPAAAPATGPRRRRLVAVLGGVAVLLAGAAVGAGTLLNRPTPSPPTERPTAAAPADPIAAVVPSVAGLHGSAAGTRVRFAWTDPQPKAGDEYLWGVAQPGQEPRLTATSATSVTIPEASGGRTCLSVSLRRSDGRVSAQPVTVCVP